MADIPWQDKILIARFNLGDREALRGMYARHRVALVTLAAALLFDKAQAEDVVHDVFARLAQKRDRIEITSNLRGYLLRSVANTARNFNRSTRDYSRATAETPVTVPRQTASPTREVLQAERCQELTSALQELPYEQREVLVLRHYGNQRFKDIAKHQGVSVNTVQGRYRYGLDKLRSILGGDL